MKKQLLVCGLVMICGIATAQEVGRVISSTPVTRDAGAQQKQTIGYKVVYEYAGKQYTTQMAEDPGATVSLQISPAVPARPAARPTVAPVTASGESIYEERWDADRDRPYRVVRSTEGWDADRDRGYSTTISSEPRYVERVYVEPTYYSPGPYYYPANYGYYGYYGSPYWPLAGLSIGLASGYRGYGGGYYRYGGHGHYGNHRGPRGR